LDSELGSRLLLVLGGTIISGCSPFVLGAEFLGLSSHHGRTPRSAPPTTLVTDVRQLFFALVSVSGVTDWACVGATNPAAATATTVVAMKLEKRITAFPIQDGESRSIDHTPSKSV